MIDENMLFNMDDGDAALQIEQEHRACASHRRQVMVKLVAEFKNPTQISKRITVEVDREIALMKRLLAQIERMDSHAEPESHDHLKARWEAEVLIQESNLVTRAMPYHLWVAMQTTPSWSHSRSALQQVLDSLEAERLNCNSQLSGHMENRPLKNNSKSTVSKD